MRKKVFAILLTLCMVLTMMPGTAWAEGETGLTLHGGKWFAYPSENENNTVGNGIFLNTMTVKFDGVKLEKGKYSVKVDDAVGAVTENSDGTFDFVPKKAGTFPIYIKYKEVTYTFYFYIDENDLPIRYFYELNNKETMLPHNSYGIGTKISGEKRENGNSEEAEFDIQSVTSNNTNAVKVTKRTNESGYDIDAVGLGEAKLTITHKGFDDTLVTKEINVNVVDEKWSCSWSAENDCTMMLPGSSVTLTAKAQCVRYNKENDSTDDVDAAYTTKWTLVDKEPDGPIKLESVDGNDKAIRVTATADAQIQDVPVRLDIYSAGNNQEPVFSTIIECRVEREYYTLEVVGFKSNLQKDEKMTLTPSLVRHYLNDGKEIVENILGATFENPACNNLDISVGDKDGTVIVTVRRRGGGDADFRLAAFLDGKMKCDRRFFLERIEDDNQGEEGPQLFIRSDEYDCYPGDGQVGNGMFNVPIKVIFQGRQVTTGYDVFVEDEKDGEIVKNKDGTFTYVPKVAGERKVTIKYGNLYADLYFDVREDDISGGGEEENGDEINRRREWTLGTKTNDGKYVPVAPNPIWSEVPTYFMHYNGKSYDNFYVMRKDDAAKVGTEAQQPELVIEADTFTSEPKGHCDGYWVWKINPTEKQPSNENFDRTKLRVKLNDVSVDGRTATNIWVLGTNYRYSDHQFRGRNIVLSSNLPNMPDSGEGIGLNEFFDSLKWDYEDYVFYTDMSQTAGADRNSFYVLHEEGTTLKVDATKLYSFDYGGTSLSGNTGGAFEKLLDPKDFLELTDTKETFTFKAKNDNGQDVTVTYTATKVSLRKYIGYENIRLSFLAVENNNKNNTRGEARMEIRNGTTIKIEGETKGVKAIRDAHNILNEALGFPPVTDDFNLKAGVAYFDKAHATFNEDGQGLVCAFDIDLKPGYVIDSITDQSGKSYKFIVKYTYYYDVYDKNGQRLSALNEMNEVGWWEAIGSQHDGQEREACMAHQEVAVSGFDVSYLDETVTSFKELLDGTWSEITPEGKARAPYKVKKRGAYVDYTVLFDQTESPASHSIVFHVSRPKDFRGSKVDVHGKNNIKIDIDVNEVTDFDITAANKNIAQLNEDGWEIEKVYEIGATDSENTNNPITNVNGLVNITISETELTGNPEDYTVVYFTEGGVPMEMPTTYVEGQGIVFTTGHFSTYAVVRKKSNPNPTTPGGLPTTPSGDPTQSGATTTTDLSGSTVSKGGETTTTVDQTTADKLVETATKNKSEEIVISVVTKNESAAASTKSAEVTLPAETLGAIAEKTDADVVIKTNVAEVKLDNQAAEAIAQQAQTASGTEGKAETVSIVAEKVKEEAKEVSFELKVVTSSGKVISDFNGGSVSVTVNVPKSLSNKKLVCVYIDENGLKHRVDGQLNADGTYTFTTGHFSTYAIMSEDDAEKAIEEQKEAIKAIKFKLSSQLVKTKSGKKAVKLTWTNPSDIEFEGVAIYRSTKKNTGYGKKSIYVSKSDKYINTAVKSGKKYYYKVRAFVTIDGEKVYTDYSYKAYRTVK